MNDMELNKNDVKQMSQSPPPSEAELNLQRKPPPHKIDEQLPTSLQPLEVKSASQLLSQPPVYEPPPQHTKIQSPSLLPEVDPPPQQRSQPPEVEPPSQPSPPQPSEVKPYAQSQPQPPEVQSSTQPLTVKLSSEQILKPYEVEPQLNPLPEVKPSSQPSPQQHQVEQQSQQPPLPRDDESTPQPLSQQSESVLNSHLTEPSVGGKGRLQIRTVNTLANGRPSDRRFQWIEFNRQLSQVILLQQFAKHPTVVNLLKTHSIPFIFILLFAVALLDVCVLYLPLIASLTIAVAKPNQKRQRILLFLTLIYCVSIQVLKIIIIEMNVESKPNCTPQMESMISTPLTYAFGSYDSEDFAISLVFTICLILLLVFIWLLHKKPNGENDNEIASNDIVLFPEANVVDGGKSFKSCIKFLMTWGFYKFGFELLLVAMTVNVYVRMDFISLLTISCAIITMVCKRFFGEAKFYRWLIGFVYLESVLIILQYASIVGLPPFTCVDYPWQNLFANQTETSNLVVWFYWPDYQQSQNAGFLLLDFIVLLLAGRLFLVLRKESACGLSSGVAQRTPKVGIGRSTGVLVRVALELGTGTTAKGIEEIVGNNKPSDMAVSFGIIDDDRKLFGFVYERKCTFDYIKLMVFKHGFWFTFSTVVIAGVANSSFLGIGYLFLATIIIRRGNTLFLLKKNVALTSKWRYLRKIETNIWLALLFYSAALMLIKVLLQLVGCVFISTLTDVCWLRQLLNIVCLDASNGDNVTSNWRYTTGKDSCDVHKTAASTFFDLFCFVCALFQQRIVESSYFKHCVMQFFIESQLQQRGKIIAKARLDHHLYTQRKALKLAKDEAKQMLAKYAKEMNKSYEPMSYGHSKRGGEFLLKPPKDLPTSSNSNSDESQCIGGADGDGSENEHLKNGDTKKLRAAGDSLLMEVTANFAFVSEIIKGVIDMLNEELYRWSRDYRFISFFLKQESEPLRRRLLEKTQSIAEHQVIEGWKQEAVICLRDFPLQDVDRNTYWNLEEQITCVQVALESTKNEKKNNRENDENFYKINEELKKEKHRLDQQKRSHDKEKGELTLQEHILYLQNESDPNKQREIDSLNVKIKALKGKIASRVKDEGAYAKKINDLNREKDRFDELVRQEEILFAKLTTLEARKAILKAKEGTISSQKSTNDALILAQDKLRATLRARDHFKHVAQATTNSYIAAVDAQKRAQIAQLSSFEAQQAAVIAQTTTFTVIAKDTADGELNSNSNILNWQMTVVGPSSDLRNGIPDPDAYHKLLTQQADSLESQLQILNELERELNEQQKNLDAKALPVDGGDIAWRLLKGLGEIVAANTHILCYLLVVIDQAASAALLTLPLMILVFAYGALRPPRPTKFTWEALIGWTWIVVLLQFLLKFSWMPWNSALYLADHGMNEPAFWPYVIGIQPTPVNTLIHIVLLIVLCFNREQLQKSGLWEDDQTTLDNVENEFQPDFLKTEVHASLIAIHPKQQQQNISHPELTRLSWTTHGRSESFLFKALSGLHFYFRRVINNKERYALDFFPLQLICYIMFLIQITFWYKDFGIVGDGFIILSVMISSLSYVFVIYVGFVFLLLIIDRAIYNASSARGRIIFHLFLFASINLYALIIIPWLSGRALVTNYTAMCFYMIFGLYMIASSAQVRHGYPENRQPSLFTRPENKLSKLAFIAYMKMPFAFEIVTFLEFACTKTRLSYRDFFTLEAIYARVYELKCIRKKDDGHDKVMDPRSVITTLLIAIGIIGFVFLLILFPLFLYSFNNVYGTQLYPDRITVVISVDGYPALYHMRAEGEAEIVPLNKAEYQWVLNTFKDITDPHNKNQVEISQQARRFINGYTQTDVLKVLLLPKSAESWAISEGSRGALQAQLPKKPIRLNVYFELRRERQNIDMDMIVQTSLTHVNLSQTTREEMAEMLSGTRDSVKIEKAWPPYSIIPGIGAVRNAPQLMAAMAQNSESFVDLELRLRKSNATQREEWSLKMLLNENSKVLRPEEAPALNDTKKELYVQQVIFVDKVVPSWMNVGPIKNGIYAIFAGIVIVYWFWMRGILVKSPLELMISEIPNVEPLYNKCKDIYMLRSMKPFENKLEVQMYSQLVHLFRSPAHLIEFTRPAEL